MLSISIKPKYVLFVIIVIAVIAGVLGRELVRNRKIDNLNEQIEQLTKTTNIQRAQIDEMTARIHAEQAERKSVEQYCTNVEAIMHESEDLNHEIIDTVSNDEKVRDWYNSPVPDDICAILHDRLCDRTCGGDKD